MNDEEWDDPPPAPTGARDIEGQRIFDHLNRELFGEEVGPTKLGRWQLLARIGQGAMGIVYSAHDPELDRIVAVKVLRRNPGVHDEVWRERLRREAQAMAKVPHDNLVAVYDVQTDAPQPYVVMELIKGERLRGWQEREERTWREITAVYTDAARGLAALHDAGLAHRDFKPENAVLDEKGRAHVVDFGLVRLTESKRDASGAWPQLTQEGALVGTPAYMSPEQLRGEQGDAKSDQFSLCRALYEALYRARPFVGDDPQAMLADIESSTPRLSPNPRKVPGWLGRCVLRGLARDPALRFPDMHALVAAIDGGGVRRARQRALALLGTIGLGFVIYYAQTPQACTGVETELNGAWDARQEEKLHRAFIASRMPDAEAIWSAVHESMSTSRKDWIELREQACLGRQNDEPPAWVIARNRCLDDTRLLLRALARGYLESSPDTMAVAQARDASHVVASQIQECARIGPFSAGPERPELAPRLTAVLAEAEADQLAGRLQEGERAARHALILAEESGVRVARAAALHRLGRILGHRRQTLASLRLLDEAVREATRAGDDPLRLDAQLFAAKLRALDSDELARADDSSVDIEDFITRLEGYGVSMTARAAELHEVRGFIARVRRDHGAALGHFLEALRLHQHLEGRVAPTIRIECSSSILETGALTLPRAGNADIARTLNNLALTVSDRRDPLDLECIPQLYQLALDVSMSALGALHPVTLDVRFDYAVTLTDLGQAPQATAVLEPALTGHEIHHGELSAPVAEVQLLLGKIALQRDDRPQAEFWIEKSISTYTALCNDTCPSNFGNALVLRGEFARLAGDLGEATLNYKAAFEQLIKHPVAAEQAADAALFVAEALAESDDVAEARRWAEQATVMFHSQGRDDDPYLLAFLRNQTTPQQATTEGDHAGPD